jgi:hypothetical protein
VTITDLLTGYGFGGAVAGVVTAFLVKWFMPAYLGQKGRNLATKEDIAEITKKIEGVKLQFAEVLEDRKAAHQMRMAALDRRLEAHQEAFALWRELVAMVYSPEIGAIVLKCQDWWDKNCLYLEPDVRQAFIQSYTAAHSHRTLVDARPKPDVVTEHWDRVMRVGDLILAAVQLPALTSVEKQLLGEAKLGSS